MSSAFMWVENGRAAAPPARAWSIGVSTSMNPSPSRWRLAAETRAERRRKTRIDSGVAQRSRYRWR